MGSPRENPIRAFAHTNIRTPSVCHPGRVAHKASGPIRKGPYVGRKTTAKATATGPGGSSDRVVVLGGGFGGLYTALRLAELSAAPSSKPLHLTLVDANDKFTFLPLLYELCTGRAGLSEVAPPFQDLLEVIHEPLTETDPTRPDRTRPRQTSSICS